MFDSELRAARVALGALALFIVACSGLASHPDNMVSGVPPSSGGPSGGASITPVPPGTGALDKPRIWRLTNAQITNTLRDQFGFVPPAVNDFPDDSRVQILAPTKINHLVGAVARLSVGSTAQHTCAVMRDGSVQCWGNNSAGQLGSAAVDVNEARFSAVPLTVEW